MPDGAQGLLDLCFRDRLCIPSGQYVHINPGVPYKNTNSGPCSYLLLCYNSL